jgi:hypothetical protein
MSMAPPATASATVTPYVTALALQLCSNAGSFRGLYVGFTRTQCGPMDQNIGQEDQTISVGPKVVYKVCQIKPKLTKRPKKRIGANGAKVTQEESRDGYAPGRFLKGRCRPPRRPWALTNLLKRFKAAEYSNKVNSRMCVLTWGRQSQLTDMCVDLGETESTHRYVR